MGESTVDSAGPGYVASGETGFEFKMDLVLGLIFAGIAGLALRRILGASRHQNTSGAAETYVVTAFYSLIGATAALRMIWFLIPAGVWQPSYVPMAVYAFDEEHPAWVGSMLSEIVVTLGSLTLFSIFCLILCYWADILKKYFHPGVRRSSPMTTFLVIMEILGGLEVLNVALFLLGIYTTEGMILFNAVLLAVVSIVCVAEISIFSHRFRTVLRTLGAINQVSTEAQVTRIIWITVTGNLFFFTRVFLEATFAILLFIFWHEYGTVAKVFSHVWWDTYTLLKYGSEITILSLMLWILQSRFAASSRPAPSQSNQEGYTSVPQAQVV